MAVCPFYDGTARARSEMKGEIVIFFFSFASVFRETGTMRATFESDKRDSEQESLKSKFERIVRRIKLSDRISCQI